MLFPTHLLAGALVGKVSKLSPLWYVVGAAIPDVVDKPLAMAGVVELYHSIGHSAVLVLLAVPVALSGRVGVAVAVGWGSHLLLDAFHVVVNGRPADAAFLAWPVAVPSEPLAIPPGSFVHYYLWTPSFFVEVVLWATALALLVRSRVSGGPALRQDG